MGLPDIDEPEVLANVIKNIQSVIDTPIQIDSSNSKAIEKAVRMYNGKPLINSVNAKQSSLDTILPIAKKYGACVLGLTLDEKGIPETAEERLKVAQKIVNTALEYGIPKEDIFIDCLMLTASAQQSMIVETIKAIRLIKEKLDVKIIVCHSLVHF